jgi:putative ATPase
MGPLAPFLKSASANERLPSLLLYGPPGTGKTTISRLIAKTTGRRLIEVSAINASVKDLRDAMEISRQEIASGKGPAVVFIDEIHRFSKVQQESLLKTVEDGEIVLVGATTENPLYSLTSAMLSRTTLLRLEPLQVADLVVILQLALSDERGLNGKFVVNPAVIELIATKSGGDARKALTILEAAAIAVGKTARAELTSEDVTASMPIALVRYDATGDQHYDIISAFIKSVRGSDPDAALHWLARMIEGGEDPRFIARRLVILAAEDVGLADPSALGLANSTMNVVSQIGMPEGRIPLASCTIYLSLAPKSNSAYRAINAALDDVRNGFTPTVPSHLRSSGLEGDGGDYEYPHDLEGAFSKQSYLPEEGKPRKYFDPKGAGFESTLLERINRLLGLKS